MSKFTITNAVQNLDDQGNPKLDQNNNYSYKVFVTDEDGGIHNFYYNTKKANVAKGEVLEGTLQQTTSKAGNIYTKFVKANSFAPRPGGYVEDPARQDAIMRQHATNMIMLKLQWKTSFMKKEDVMGITDEMIMAQALKYVEFYKAGKVSPPAPTVDSSPPKTATEVFKDQVGSKPDYSRDDPFADAVDYQTEEA